MSEDSNDVVVVNEETSNAGDESSAKIESRPIMQLFQRLISNDNKQNTVLTNAQIISILLKEFDIDITLLHELEVDIYLNVVKRFLKDWPKWDEFDQGINTLRKKNANKSIKKTLESKYIELKSYLTVQLEATKPLAKDAVMKILKENTKRMEKINTSDITLEVFCTRKQLNELILSHPTSTNINSEETNVFNLTEFAPSSIIVNKLPIESILNWWSISVSVDCKALLFTRSTNHLLKHVLVNAKSGPRDLKRELRSCIQIENQKRISSRTRRIGKEELLSKFDELLQIQQHNNEVQIILQTLINIAKTDIAAFDRDIKIPGAYRQHSNKYPYYRKLRKQVEEKDNSIYDLYIEETLAPMHVINFGKVGEIDPTDNQIYMTVECIECKLKFGSVDICTALREHYDMYHANEPDWTCTNCEKTFSTTELTMNKWYHCC